MASYDELARDYANRLVNAYNKEVEAQQLAYEIRNLVYEPSRQPLAPEDRERVAKGIYRIISDEIRYTRAVDNADYLALVEYILQQVKR